MNNYKKIQLDTQIAQQQIKLEHAVMQALELARARSDAAEVKITKNIGLNISTRYGQLENIEFNNDGALGITVYCNLRKGSASSTDISKKAIASTVNAAIDIARYTSTDKFSGLATKDLLAFDAPNLDLFHPTELSPEFGITLASEAEQAALHFDNRITKTEGGHFNSNFITTVFGNSYGMLQSYNSSCYSLYCSVIAESDNDMQRNYAYSIGRAIEDLRTPQWIGEECARRTLSHLNSRKLPTMEAPVLFAAEVASSLFGHLVNAIIGNNVYQKATFLLHDLGNQIMPDWLSIEEHPHVPKGLASAPFDSEGVKTHDRTILQNGVLKTWLLNNYAARKLGLQSTGHASGIYNWFISHKPIDFNQLVKEMGYGLIVTELMGQGVNYINGDYSRGAAGFWVEHGQIQYPVSEITIAGNLKEMLRDIVTISNDIDNRNNIKLGSVLLPVMKIAGK